MDRTESVDRRSVDRTSADRSSIDVVEPELKALDIRLFHRPSGGAQFRGIDTLSALAGMMSREDDDFFPF